MRTAFVMAATLCGIQIWLSRGDLLQVYIVALHVLLHLNFHLLLLPNCLILEQSNLALDSNDTPLVSANLLVVKRLDEHPIARILINHGLGFHVRYLW